MGFSLNKVSEHVEQRTFELYGQTFAYGFRPSVLDKPLQRRMQQLEELEEEAKLAWEAAYDAWEKAGGEGDPPKNEATPSLDEVCEITKKVIANWNMEKDGHAIPVEDVKARVEDGTIPLLVLFEVFGDAIKGGSEVSKRGGRRRR